MRNFIMVTALLLCSLSWISVSGSESQTVEVQSGEKVTLLCSNFSSATTQIIWFKLVDRSQPRCVASIFKPLEPARVCSGFQSGKFELRSNLSTLFLKIKHVDFSDSGLYFCGYYAGRDPVMVSATYLEVQEMFDGITKPMSVILGTLVIFLIIVIVCLAVKIKTLQKAHVEGQKPQQTERHSSDDLNYASVAFRPKSNRHHRPVSEGHVETHSIYSALR